MALLLSTSWEKINDLENEEIRDKLKRIIYGRFYPPEGINWPLEEMPYHIEWIYIYDMASRRDAISYRMDLYL
jgi:hypothetical protein